MKISLVVPTIGKSPFLAEAIASALQQTEAFDEILLFGNGVTPAVLQASLGAGLAGRVRIVTGEKQLPPNASWNAAIAAATHDFVAIMGDDDLFDPSMGQTIRRGLALHPFVAAGYQVIAADGAVISGTEWHDELLPPRVLYERLYPVGGLALLLPGIAFARGPFTQVGGFPAVPLTNGWLIDTECWSLLGQATGGLRLLAGQHWRYRLNPGQLGLKKSMDQFASELRQYSGQHTRLRAALGLAPMTPGEENAFVRRMVLARYLSGIRNRSFNGLAPGARDVLMFCRLMPGLGMRRSFNAVEGLLRLAYRYYRPARRP